MPPRAYILCYFPWCLCAAMALGCNVAAPVEVTLPEGVDTERNGAMADLFENEEKSPCEAGQLHAIEGEGILAPCPLGTNENDMLGRLVDADFKPIDGELGRPIAEGRSIAARINRASLSHHSVDTLREKKALAGAGFRVRNDPVQTSASATARQRSSYAVSEASYWTEVIRFDENDVTYRTDAIAPNAAYHIEQIILGSGCTLIHESDTTEVDLAGGMFSAGTIEPLEGGSDGDGLNDWRPLCTPRGVENATKTHELLLRELAEAQQSKRFNKDIPGTERAYQAYMVNLLDDISRARELLALENACSTEAGPDPIRTGPAVARGFTLNFSFYNRTGMIRTDVHCSGVDTQDPAFFFAATLDQVAQTFRPQNTDAVTPQQCLYSPLPRFVCVDGTSRLGGGEMLNLVFEMRKVVIHKSGAKKPKGNKNDRWEWDLTADTFVNGQPVHSESVWSEPHRMKVDSGSETPTNFRYLMSSLPSGAPIKVQLGGTKDYIPHKSKRSENREKVRLPRIDIRVDSETVSQNTACDPNDPDHWQEVTSGEQSQDTRYTAEVCFRSVRTEIEE